MNTKTTENYIGYESLVSYLIESNNCLSYCRFLSLNQDTIIASLTQLTSSSLTLAKWQSIDITWYKRFLNVAKKLLEPDIFVAVKDKVRLFLFCKVWVTPNTRRSHLTFWQGIIKEYEKKNLTPAIYNDASSPKETDPTDLSKTSQEQEIIKEYEKKNLISDITNVASFPKKTAVISNVKSPSKETNEVPAGFFKTSQKQEIIKEYEKENFKSFSKKIEILQTDIQSDISLQKETSKVSETSQLNLPKKNIKLINFCYDILHELEDESYANLFYKYAEDIKNKDIKHPMDLFTINSKLENNQYISLEEFENDIHLIFRN
ncbi:17204_t:CDS:2, partial [Rhizophagus irregularis]